MLRDRTAHTAHRLGDVAETGSRDLAHRARGLLARGRGIFRQGRPDDDVLVARVRAELGRYVSHPRSIEVEAKDGAVTLRGPILTHEAARALRAVRRVRGVRAVDNHLQLHAKRSDVSGLQGGESRPGRRWELFQYNWSPSTRLLVGAAGIGLGLYGVKRRSALGVGISVIGGALLARSSTNMPIARFVGVRGGRRVVDFHKTIEVAAPIDEVFRFWTRIENFPRFMEHVREVHLSSDGRRSHWKVAGPIGRTVEWDAEMTQLVTNEVFAWRTLPGASVEHAGIVRFEPSGERSTRLDIRMSYNPPAGVLGHALARLFRCDPKSALDDDLVRAKSLLESGKATAHGETVTREELLH